MQTIHPAVTLTAKEKARLRQICQEVDPAERSRYQTLTEKFETRSLTDSEYAEYLTLLDKIEAVGVKRLEYLAQIARQRSLSLIEFMRLTGLKSTYA